MTHWGLLQASTPSRANEAGWSATKLIQEAQADGLHPHKSAIDTE